MSSKRHRRNYSLASGVIPRPLSPPLNRSLRKINTSSNHNWLLISAKDLYFKSNDMKTATLNFEQYLKHNPTHLEALYLCGVCYMHLRQYALAVSKLSEYLSLKKVSNRKLIISSALPNNNKAFLLLAIAYSKLHYLTKSLDTINEALKQDSRFEEGYCLRAKLYLKMNEPQRAFNDYRQALKINSMCLAAEIGLADYYNACNNFSSALRHYQTARQWMRDKPQLDQEGDTDSALTGVEVDLKTGICLYHLGDSAASIVLLEPLLANKETPNLSEIYYYLALCQLKPQENQRGKRSEGDNLLRRSEGDNLLRQAFLNLEFSIKSNTNGKITEKACKMLIRLLVENNQFYETENVLQLSTQYKIPMRNYRDLCEGCMLVIKQKYEKATPILKKLYLNLKSNPNKCVLKISDMEDEWQKPTDSNLLRESAKKIKSNRNSQPNTVAPLSFKRGRISTEEIRAESLHHSRRQAEPLEGHQAEPLGRKVEPLGRKVEPLEDNIEWMEPTILLFRAYAEYFSDSFIECLETYELYENYLKDYLGKEPEADIALSYNKVLCEGLLMLDNEMVEDSLEKFNTAIDNYYRFTRAIPAEPILFRVIALMRLALSDDPTLSDDPALSGDHALGTRLNSRSKIMQSILGVVEDHKPAIKKNSLVYYYAGLVYYDLDMLKEASDSVEQCLKLAEECTWKFLYVKGVIEMKRKLFKEAVRQFAAGMMIEERPELYLGRCLCYLSLFEESGEEEPGYIQKSFEDLQKFIELEENKDKISRWVTKILFFNKAYDEVCKSIKKVSSEVLETNEEIIQISKCLNIYNGQFEEGGIIGRLIMNAFDGRYEDGYLYIQEDKHDIVFSDFFHPSYGKWMKILNLYAQEKYADLIKYIQLCIFEEKREEEILELRYNLAITYYLMGETLKADNVIAGLEKYTSEATHLIDKFLTRNFSQDQCVSDLYEVTKGVKRLSTYLPFRKAILSRAQVSGKAPNKAHDKAPNKAHDKASDKATLSCAQTCELAVFLKISIPMPQFPKPNIILSLEHSFLVRETSQSCIPKKIEAPWIKKVTGKIQFTDNMIESEESSFNFGEDVALGDEALGDDALGDEALLEPSLDLLSHDESGIS